MSFIKKEIFDIEIRETEIAGKRGTVLIARAQKIEILHLNFGHILNGPELDVAIVSVVTLATLKIVSIINEALSNPSIRNLVGEN